MNHPANHASRVPWSISATDPLVIAEIGVNHDGDLTRCLELVHAAGSSGADAVKFQWFRAEQLVTSGADTARYQKAATTADQRSMLAELELDACAMKQLRWWYKPITSPCTSIRRLWRTSV